MPDLQGILEKKHHITTDLRKAKHTVPEVQGKLQDEMSYLLKLKPIKRETINRKTFIYNDSHLYYKIPNSHPCHFQNQGNNMDCESSESIYMKSCRMWPTDCIAAHSDSHRPPYNPQCGSPCSKTNWGFFTR